MSSKAKFYFELEDGSPLVLTYNLQENSLKDRWCKQVEKRKKEKDTTLELKISNRTKPDIPKLLLKLNSIIEEINKYYDIPLPLFENVNFVDHKILNFLHSEFERYGERHLEAHTSKTYGNRKTKFWTSKPFNLKFHENWLSLNQWIHIVESVIDSKDFPIFSCLVQYYPPTQGDKINKEDKLFLTTEFDWGHLFLGYNTLGKDYMHTADHNDVRVITNNQIKIQKRFSTEVFLNFSTDNREKKKIESLFWQWYLNQPEDVKSLIPIDNPTALALGRYYLGYLEYDSTFLDFHPNIDDWANGNVELQKRWNFEVFSKIVKVTNIEIC